MRQVHIIFKWVVSSILLLALVAAVWLYVAPPALIRVGSGYAAKIVCSNVFLAMRDPGEVLAEDVQAPGHPLLKLMRMTIDPATATIHTGLFGLFGKGLAVFRGGTGCTVVPDGDLKAVKWAIFQPPADAENRAELWPDGIRIDVSQDPKLVEILDDKALTGPGMRDVVVIHNGRIIGERFGDGIIHFDQPLLGWSMTKTVTAAIIGTLVEAGRISVDDANLLPEWEGDGRTAITIADLLGMESGLEFNEDYGDVTDVTRMLYLEPDMASFAADKPLEAEPGARFSYSSGTSVILSRIWQNGFEDQKAALYWPREALFEPLGMHSAVLETDARGTFVGSSNMYASARDWARFGQFLLQDGQWKGKQILPAGWVDWMRTPTKASNGDYGRHVWLHGPRVTTPANQHPDTGFDLPKDAYWLLGHDGQTITIIPSKNLVVVRLGLTPTKLGYKPQALVEAVVDALGDTGG